MAHSVDYKDFKVEKMVAEEMLTKTTKDKKTNQDIKYYEIHLKYKYDVKTEKGEDTIVIDDFNLRGPEMFSGYGVGCKTFNQDNGDSNDKWSMGFSINTAQDEKGRDFIKVLNVIYEKTVEIFNVNKAGANMKVFDPKNPQTMYRHIVYTYTDSNNDPIPGKPNLFTAKLSPGSVYFCRPKTDEKIALALLQDAQVKGYPIFHFQKLYIGGNKVYGQVRLKGMIVTSVVPRNNDAPFKSMAQSLMANNPDIDEVVSQNLAKLAMERQDKLLPTPKPPKPAGEKKDETPKVTDPPKIPSITDAQTQTWLQMGK